MQKKDTTEPSLHDKKRNRPRGEKNFREPLDHLDHIKNKRNGCKKGGRKEVPTY